MKNTEAETSFKTFSSLDETKIRHSVIESKQFEFVCRLQCVLAEFVCVPGLSSETTAAFFPSTCCQVRQPDEGPGKGRRDQGSRSHTSHSIPVLAACYDCSSYMGVSLVLCAAMGGRWGHRGSRAEPPSAMSDLGGDMRQPTHQYFLRRCQKSHRAFLKFLAYTISLTVIPEPREYLTPCGVRRSLEDTARRSPRCPRFSRFSQIRAR